MKLVDFIVQPEIDPSLSLATDRHLMRAVLRRSRTRTAVLRVYGFSGDVMALGRYHRCPSIAAPGDVAVFRRPCGGRVLPFGAGFVGVSLILPHRAALVADNPLALAPYQVLNRYVRGLLEACRLLQLPAYYPGRDLVTVNRRVLAAISFETDDRGALLFEAILANARDFGSLPGLLDRADPEGSVKTEVMNGDSMTSLTRELGRSLGFDEVAERIREGFAKQFNLQIESHTLSALETQAVQALAARDFAGVRWVQRRQRRPDLDRHISLWAQLGALEAYLSLQQERFIKEVEFTGDFIANSASIDELERELRLCPLEWRAIDTVASRIFSRPENFILGIGKVRTIADMIMRGVAA